MTDEPDPRLVLAVRLAVALCPTESSLLRWGAAHAETLAPIEHEHPPTYRAARAEYARRLAELKETKR